MEVHRGRVGGLRDDGGADTARRADRPEQVGGAATVVAHHGWTRTALGPDASETALLAHPGLVLEPDLDRCPGRAAEQLCLQQEREVFLYVSCFSRSRCGWNGRG